VIDALYIPPKPAIIQPAQAHSNAVEAALAALHADMLRKGVPRHVRRSVAKEVERIIGDRSTIIRPALVEIERSINRDGFLPAGILINPYIFGGFSTPGTTGTFAQSNASTKTIGGSAQSGGLQFTAPFTGELTTIKWSVATVNSSGDWECRLYTNNSGSPGTQIGSSTAAVTINSTGDKTFTFTAHPGITASTVYWLVITPVSGSPSFDANACTDQAGYGSGRHSTITSITDTAISGSDEWRTEINYLK
jgi:hypothetical protein